MGRSDAHLVRRPSGSLGQRRRLLLADVLGLLLSGPGVQCMKWLECYLDLVHLSTD